MKVAERYDLRIAVGACVRCGGKNDNNGKRVTCQKCLDKLNRQKKVKDDMYKAMGVCIKCKRNDAEEDSSTCAECKKKFREQNRKSARFYRDLGICPRCKKNSIVGDEKTCIECRTAISNYMDKKRAKWTDEDKAHALETRKELKKKWEAQGVCNKCGCRPALEGLKYCQICKNKRRKHYLESEKYSKENKIEYRRKNGLCHFCDDKALEGMRVCQKHYDRLYEVSHSDRANEARKKCRPKIS